MRKRIAKKIKAKKEARELIPELLNKSKAAYKKGDKRLSKVYSKKIRFLYMKHKIRLPKEIKRQLCKNCYGILIPSLNCRVRTKEGRLIIYCLDCKKYTRIGFK
ncbi:ribonuclease P protein component 4 [Candidatus Woesearchaeota archaeon]|nr:ribonuclease P protein component 4 [Candidatus Woesearchaeota archaeon]